MNLCETYLLERGLSPEFARQNGVEFDFAPARDRIVERLGKDFIIEGKRLSQLIQEMLWFPLSNHEALIKSWLARPLPTISDRKFLFPCDSLALPYVPKAVWLIRKKTDQPVIFTEGPVKGLVLHQAGARSIALGGVWMAASENAEGKYTLRSELLDFEWLGRIAYLCFDADQNSNPKVLHAVIRTAFVLTIQGARPTL